MNIFFRAIIGCLLVFMASCIVACSEKAQSLATQSVTKKEVKPGANVKLVSPAVINLNQNEKSNIEILLESAEAADELKVSLTHTAGLDLLDTPLEISKNLTSSSVAKIPVALLAEVNGRYYLKLHVVVASGGETSVRNLAVIVQVGPSAEKAAQQQKMSGENVISLPAQETISPK